MTSFRDIQLRWEWLTARDVKAPELRATWARLEVYVGTSCLTLVEDVESGSARRSVFISLYPLAEWIAFNWWSLIAGTRPASLIARIGRGGDPLFEPSAKRYRLRHGLRSAGDGFLLPNLLVLPQGESTHLSWRADADIDPAYPIRYLTSGDCMVDAQEMREKLGHLVESVIVRLDERGLSDTALHAEWRTVQDTGEDEAAYCLAAARMGLDPYSEAAEYESQILAAANHLEGGLLADFLDAVEPERIDETLAWVTRTAERIAEMSVTVNDVRQLRSEVRRLMPPSTAAAHSLIMVGWRQGGGGLTVICG